MSFVNKGNIIINLHIIAVIFIKGYNKTIKSRAATRLSNRPLLRAVGSR